MVRVNVCKVSSGNSACQQYKMKLFRKQSSANAVESEREVNKSKKGKREGGKIRVMDE